MNDDPNSCYFLHTYSRGRICTKHSAHTILFNSPTRVLWDLLHLTITWDRDAMHFPFPPGHPTRPHFPDSLAVGGSPMTGFYPIKWERRQHDHSLPGLRNLPCSAPSSLLRVGIQDPTNDLEPQDGKSLGLWIILRAEGHSYNGV